MIFPMVSPIPSSKHPFFGISEPHPARAARLFPRPQPLPDTAGDEPASFYHGFIRDEQGGVEYERGWEYY
jgi:hypothetical protein